MTTNRHGQPVGQPMGDWQTPPFPPGEDLTGRHVDLEVLSPERHIAGLWSSLGHAPESLWTYMTFGPFADETELGETLTAMCDAPDWLPYAFVSDGEAMGFASYLRINPGDGVIEIGAITLAPAMQRTTAATEGLYSMIKHVFDLGYRRCEWKCDDLNEASRRAAERLGFVYEGTFAQATHYKGRNRDTAWYSIVDHRWPSLDRAFQDWLNEDNFDDSGTQKLRLEEIRR